MAVFQGLQIGGLSLGFRLKILILNPNAAKQLNFLELFLISD